MISNLKVFYYFFEKNHSIHILYYKYKYMLIAILNEINKQLNLNLIVKTITI